MRLTVLGCAGSLPGPDSACSAYLAEAGGFRLLLDLGSGALGPLQRFAGLLDVDALLLTHLHGDHCLDAAPYAYARAYSPAGPQPPLPLLGPAGAADRLVAAQGNRSSIEAAYDVGVLTTGRRTLGPFELTTVAMNHPVETYGLRLTAGGATLAYSADTGPGAALVELARDADLLLCEATFPEAGEHPPNLHLTGREAGEHAARADVGRLVVTHVPPWGDPEQAVDAAAAVYDGPIESARPGAAYEL